ncbi:hypothetical protein DPMN_091714 [Dreissena polymorpha]|uniref:Uncharacterized protein n=1 Tax=Dreissena polymorpha TaxID=45954 RepID=A0A9D4R0Z0_DREPO|nr:hypothetical protein DPMN_091714 [Dreissena polymorpha]
MEGSICEHKNEINALKKQVNDQKVVIEALILKKCETEYSQSSSLNDLCNTEEETASGFLASAMTLTNKHQLPWPMKL